MQIRNATESDFDFILKANSDISGHSHQSGIDPENQARLKSDLFGTNPKCWAIIAEDNGRSVGMALYSTVYFANEGQLCWVSQIYVIPEYRRHIATGLLVKKINEIAKQNNWLFICSAVDNENSESNKLLSRVGATSLNNFTIWVAKAK